MTVGTSGMSAERDVLATANPLILLDFTDGNKAVTPVIIMCTCPEYKSVRAGALPV